jgi:KTSC domain
MRKQALAPTCLPIFVAVICVAPGFCEEPTNASKHVVSHIPRQEVQSTAIAKVGYSKRRHILEIEFVNRAVYRYFDVPLPVYRDLMSAESKARFYDSNIRKHYRSALVRQRQKQESPKQSIGSAQAYRAAAHK